MSYPYTVNDTSLTLVFKGKAHNITSDQRQFKDLVEFLKSNKVDDEYLTHLVDVKSNLTRITAGLVTVEAGKVMYSGVEVHSALARKLLTLYDQGYDIDRWAKFMDNLYKNPSYRSREDLFGFLEKWQAPITEDGCFIAFKNVRENFYDIHSNTMDNSPGLTVSMPRGNVDDDGRNTCSAGLHVCATSYLSSFYVPGGKTIIVKVNPQDVVSVPHDYNNAKMRVCKYVSISEVSSEEVTSTASSPVYNEAPTLSEYVEDMVDEDDSYYDSYDSYYDSY